MKADSELPGEQCAALPTALQPALEVYLAEIGASVIGELPTKPRLAEPQFDRFLYTQPVDQALFQFVRDEPYGWIKFDPWNVCRARLIAQLALAYPELSILILEYRQDDCELLARDIGEFGVIATARHGKLINQHCRRVHVCTPQSATQFGIETHGRSIVIASDLSEVLDARGWEAVSWARNARLYGMLPTYQRLSPRQEVRARAMFGFPELTIPRHGCIQRPVVVSQECFR